jgi:hypothetical protein
LEAQQSTRSSVRARSICRPFAEDPRVLGEVVGMKVNPHDATFWAANKRVKE